MKTAIIVGGAGFIGTHLVSELRADFRVIVVDVAGPSSSLPGVEYVTGDVRRPLNPAGFPPKPDLVINLAAVHREPGHKAHEYFDTNVTGVANVLALGDELGAENVILTSSISVYGTSDDSMDETRAVAPATPYGESKAEAEELVRAWADRSPGRVASIARPAAVFGPGEGGNFTRLANALRRRRFVFPGRADTIKGCGYILDLTRALTFMHGRPGAPQTYNFAFPKTYQLDDICDSLVRAGGLAAPRGTVPLSVMRRAGRLGDHVGVLGRKTGLSERRIEKLVTSTDIRPAALIEAGFDFHYDLDSALEHWFNAPPAGSFV